MTAAQQVKKQRIKADRVLRKRQRICVLASLLEMHESQNGTADHDYIKGLKHRLQKSRNELRNMGADRNGEKLRHFRTAFRRV